jgi:hypothetical protein
MIPVKGHTNLFRDPSSGAIINKDRTNAGIEKVARLKFTQDQNRLKQLEEDISIIKNLLKQLLEK